MPLTSEELALLLDDEDEEFVRFLQSICAMVGIDVQAEPSTAS